MDKGTDPLMHIGPIARLGDCRALKSSNLEDFTALKPFGQIGGLILQSGDGYNIP